LAPTKSSRRSARADGRGLDRIAMPRAGNARLILVIHSDNDRSVPVQQAMRSFIADVDKKK
jgi:hypothetical protein